MSSYGAAVTAPLGAYGALKQGETDANISEYNANIASQNAETDRALGAEAARRSLVNSTKMIGTESAAYGASGVSQMGSAQWVMSASAAQGELNALTIKHGYDMKATALNNEANLDMFKAHNQRTAAYLSAASIMLGAGANAYGNSAGGGGSTAGTTAEGGASADNAGGEGDYSAADAGATGAGEEAVVM